MRRSTPAYLLAGGLGMPDRDYYLSTDAKMVAFQTAYRAHIATVLRLAGVGDADAKAGRIYDLEHRIAQAQVSRAESEDVHKANNPWPVAQFAARRRGWTWPSFLKAPAWTASGPSSSGSRSRSASCRALTARSLWMSGRTT